MESTAEPAIEPAVEPAVPAVEPAEVPAEVATGELEVTMDSTLKEMQTFAAEHPELGPIAGRSKAVFFENLTAAWQKKNAELAPAAPVQEAEELPVSMGNTLKEMQAFASAHPELGEIQGKTKAVFLASLSEAWSKKQLAAAPAVEEPVEESVEAAKEEVEVEATTTELPVTMASTLKAMQAFAAEHPELGEIQGKTKALFFANLNEAWSNRGYTEATLPVTASSTLKEMQQFAEMLSASLGEMPKKSVAKAVFFDDLTARLRACGLLR
jgi:GH25 family lysozyme M1 (1,4-beta-N-acetylmuramidase)